MRKAEWKQKDFNKMHLIWQILFPAYLRKNGAKMNI